MNNTKQSLNQSKASRFGSKKHSVNPGTSGYTNKSSELEITYEDPAAALNFSETRWNQLVQDKIKEQAEKDKRLHEERRLKLIKIQQEQRQQVIEKQKIREEEKRKEREHFNTVGVNSSDVYYVN